MSASLKNQYQQEAERLLITGANGFIGRELCAKTIKHGWQVRAVLRGSRQLPLVSDRVSEENLDCGSLQVNIDKTREILNWSPPISIEEALRKTAQDYLRKRQ